MVLTVPWMPDQEPYPDSGRLEEHLLERISLLETRLAGLSSRYAQLLELIQKQCHLSSQSNQVVEALIHVLAEDFSLDAAKLHRRLQPGVSPAAKPPKAAAQAPPQISLSEHIVANFHGRAAKSQFTGLVAEGFEKLAQGEDGPGVRLLERAARLDPANTELSFIIARHHFRLGKTKSAAEALRQTLANAPEHFEALLMMGALCAENGQAKEAYEYLTRALKQQKDCFVALYILGRLLAAEGAIREALSYLKRALDINPSSEMHYLVGHIYLKRGMYSPALRHLHKAVELDPRCDAALYHLGLIYLKRNRVAQARNYFQAAYDLNPVARYRTALRAHGGDDLPLFPPFGKPRSGRYKIVTSGDANGDEHLAKILNDALFSRQ